MVQGGLLTDHPGSVHGGGEAPRGHLPPAGCREEVFWCSRSWKRGGGGTESRSRKRVLSSRVSKDGEYIGEGGPARGATRGPGAPLAWPSPWSRQVAAWGPGGSHLVLLRGSGMFRHADFYLIFPNF